MIDECTKNITGKAPTPTAELLLAGGKGKPFLKLQGR